MEDELRNLETSIIEELAAGCRRTSGDELAAQRDADIWRLTADDPVMQTPEGIRDRLRGMLVLSIEIMGERYEDRAWSAGLEGAILQGRMSILREALDWLSNRDRKSG